MTDITPEMQAEAEAALAEDRRMRADPVSTEGLREALIEAAEQAHIFGPDHDRRPIFECSYEPCRRWRVALRDTGPRPDSGIDVERLAEVFARALEDQDFTGFRNWLALAREVAADLQSRPKNEGLALRDTGSRPPSDDGGPRPDSGIDAAYRERNAVVAALIRSNGYRAEVVMAPDTEGWFIVYADTPAGQVSWHISPDDMDLFSDWPVAFGTSHSPWDGHDTNEKYRRVARLSAPRTETSEPIENGWSEYDAPPPGDSDR